MMIAEQLIRARVWLTRVGPRLLMVVLGFALGGITFGLCSGEAPDPHAAAAAPGAVDGGGAARDAVWTCSMHPQIRQPEPGQCPICGMDLIPAVSDDGAVGGDGGRVVLSDRARALAQLRTAPVRRQSDGAADIRLLGRVEPDEESLRTVTAWTGGRIDRLFVRSTGESVRAGQTIATLYSPEVFAAHQDLLIARTQVSRMADGVDSAQRASAAALAAARERLRLLGVPADELAQMENAEHPTTALPIRTPFGGTVIERLATEGAYVTTGAPLYRIADLGRLWVQLDAYESDLGRIAIGDRVRVEVEAFSAEEIEGKITFIDPTLDPARRTARVRVEIDNRDGHLRPGMFAQAIVAAETEQGADAPLVVPSTAPLFTGRRAVVYVEVSEGGGRAYEPRTVRLGPRLGSVYPVVAGLSEGERIVSHGAFALDADLQIQGGPSMMAGGDDDEPGAWDAAIDVPPGELRRLTPVVAAYLTTQRALAADDLPGARTAASALERALPKAGVGRPTEAKTAWARLAPTLRRQARRLAEADAIEEARTGFEALSTEIAQLLRHLGNPLERPLVLAHCPMAFGSRGADWVQEGGVIDNPYFGAAMRTCGSVEQTVPAGAHLPAPAAPGADPPTASPAGGREP